MKLKMTKYDKIRFWSKVDKSGDCWIWIGYIDKDGYGSFGINCKKIRAHRLSHMLSIGPITNNLYVCHKCNVKNCVNPEHLYLATHKQNMIHAGRDGLLKGSPIGNPILTKEKVIQIRKLYSLKKNTQKQLAKIFKVQISAISKIVTYRTWKNI